MSEDSERRMRRAFRKQAREAIDKLIEREQGVPVVGMELEFATCDEHGRPVLRESVDDERIGKELGHHQVEIITEPHEIRNVRQFCEDYTADVVSVTDRISQRLAGVGSIPNLSLERYEVTPGVEKYKLVPTFNNQRVDASTKTMFPQLDARHVGLFNAMQINIDAWGAQDAVDKLNRSLAISPYLVAMFANARYIHGKESGFKDARIDAWRETHDIRTPDQRCKGFESRIGLPQRYFSDLQDYLARVGSHHFILDDEDHALQVGIGLNWHDARIKFLEKENRYLPLVEMRSISAQPDIESDIAATLLYVGMLESEDALADMSWVHFNKHSATKYGLDGCMYEAGTLAKTIDVVKDKYLQAREALVGMGYCRRSLDAALGPAQRILDEELTPADRYSQADISALVVDSLRN